MVNAVISSISEFVAFLLQSFRLAFVLPAFIFSFINIYTLPYLLSENEIARRVAGFSLNAKLAYILGISFILGYFLSIINIWLIRLYEGYHWKDFFPGPYLVESKRQEYCRIREKYLSGFKKIDEDLQKLTSIDDPDFDKLIGKQTDLSRGAAAQLNQYLRENYPYSREPFLPTSLGNVISAFEDYPKDRYQIDAVTLWPRLLPILSEKKYTLYVEREKAALDFLINMSFLFLILGIEAFCLGMALALDAYLVLWIAGTCGLTVISYWLYKLSIISAYGWGAAVKTAFDLYRYDLLVSLFGKAPVNFESERLAWGKISHFFQGDHQYLEKERGDKNPPPQTIDVFDYERIDRFLKEFGAIKDRKD